MELFVKDENGAWQAATEENFPEEGIWTEVPYPEGIDPDDYDFVLTHMFGSGERVGEVEILEYERTKTGLNAKFTSFSPVGVVYQLKPEPTIESIMEDMLNNPNLGLYIGVGAAAVVVLVLGGVMIRKKRAKKLEK